MSSEARHPLFFAAVWAGAAILGSVWWLVGLAGDGPAAWRALLTAFCFFTPLAGGLATWTAVVQISNGGWAGETEELADLALGFAPVSVLALGLLWIGAGDWAPWAGRRTEQGAWLSPAFLFGRDMAGLVLFWLAAVWRRLLLRKGRVRGGKAAVLVVVAYGVVFSLLGFDLVMALDPKWRSPMFGGYFFISGLYAALAAWALLAALSPDADPDRLHDFGKLVVAFCMLTAYLMYSQLLPIWYENLPRETRFLVPRLNVASWRLVGYGLLAVVYLGPVAFLLPVRAKRSRTFLAAVCLLVLVGLVVERWWLIAPQFRRPPTPTGADVAAFLALLGLLGLGMELVRMRTAPLPPLGGEQRGPPRGESS